MTLRNQIYIGSLATFALLITLTTTPSSTPSAEAFAALFVLVSLATIAQFFEVRFADGHSYYPHSLFFFAGVLLLPPLLLIPLFAIPLALAVVRTQQQGETYAGCWWDWALNVAIYTLVGSCAHGLYLALNSHLNELIEVGQGFAALVAASLYVMGTHLLFRLANTVINQATWRESGLWLTENLWVEFVMTYLAYLVVVLWYVNPVMILPMFGVLVLMQKALLLPKLRHEAQTDGKTGLLNIRYFNRLVADTLARSKQTGRTFSVIMADLDFLRRINNHYGHLAGDMVLIGVSRIIQHTVRHADAVGRFGGEEFAVLLPDIDQEEAFSVAERIRVAIEGSCFEVPTSQAPVQATMSFGIASYPYDADTVTELIHQADVAVYQAKLEGRNRVVSANDLMYRVKESKPFLKSQDAPIQAAAANMAVKRVMPVDEGETEFPTEEGSSSSLYDLLSPLTVKLGVIGLALALVGWGVVWQQPVNWGLVYGLALLAAVTQYVCVRLFALERLSVAASILFAASLLIGVPGIAVVSVATTLAAILGRTDMPWRQRFHSGVLYQWATDVVAGFTPALLTTILSLSLHVNNALLFSIPFLLVALAYSYTTVALTVLAQVSITGKRFGEVWREEYQELPWHYLLLALIGLCFSIVYTMFDWRGMILSMLPIYIMYFSQDQLLEQTRQWWGTLIMGKKQWS
ncbi:MAG: GGDEF domain-containing protein [Caldilineaceae bacterium]|nr:GGDEF domain-containing protein [Caldilineaceae bacterium]